MNGNGLSRTICAIFLLFAVSGLANCGGNSSTAQLPPPPPANQTPTITGIFPNRTAAGCAAFRLVIEGTNFVAASTVNFGGSATATTFFSSTLLNAAIPAASIASTGTPAVTVTNPAPDGGTSNSLTFTATTNTMGAVDPQSIAVDPTGKFAYVANEGCPDVGGDVSMYTINPTTGALASTGMIAAAANDVAVSVAVDPAGKFAYVANSGGSISMYTIDATTGALASIGPPVPTNDEFTDSVTVDPFGKFAYVASSGNVFDCDFGSLLTYTINPTTGALTSTTGGIIGTGVNGTPEFFNSVALNPSGKFAYATDAAGESGNSSSVSMFTINSTTGALTSIGIIAAGTGPDSVAVDPAGKFAYVTNFGSNDVSMYTIDATTGALASIGTIAAGTGPVSVVVDPSGKFAYAVNFSSNDVAMYTINATTGALTSIGTIAAGLSPTWIAVHPSGKFAYVTNSASNDVSMYSIDGATGALTVLGQ
jgi:6-phosphogluconolactonase